MSNPYPDYSKGVFTKPLPPPECQTDAEKTAFAFGWWKALEAHRLEQRTWVGLTDEERSKLWEISRAALPRYATYASLVEAKLKEKNQ